MLQNNDKVTKTVFIVRINGRRIKFQRQFLIVKHRRQFFLNSFRYCSTTSKKDAALSSLSISILGKLFDNVSGTDFINFNEAKKSETLFKHCLKQHFIF
jgi:hypothetical protein